MQPSSLFNKGLALLVAFWNPVRSERCANLSPYQKRVEEKSYINRELSWLEFNRRVLEEARDESVPLLERVKFLAIFSSNLDEFFMVRVARLKKRAAASDQIADPDGLNPAATLTAISRKVHELVQEQHLCFLQSLQPQLAAEGIHILRP